MRYNLFNEMHEEIKKSFNELEQETMQLSSDIFYGTETGEKKLNPYCLLYHGVRFDEDMKKLEKIFQTKKLLAGKYTDNYYDYGDNANKGEYVSLIGYSSEVHSDFNFFILENISFLVSPSCDAYLTKYVSYDEWEKLKDENTKNLYSYMMGEYMKKDEIPFTYIKAIGYPYKYYASIKGEKYADERLKKLVDLMCKYKINTPIVDTSCYNKILNNCMNKKSGR